MSRALIFVNGRIPNLDAVRNLLLPYDIVIAADGGSRHVLSLGLLPTFVVGDLDSLSSEDQHEIKKAGTKILKFPRDKNETDFELALNYAITAGHHRILVIAALGGRTDQTIGNLCLLTNPAYAGLDIRADDGVEELIFTRKTCRFIGKPGDLVSLIPWGGEVTSVTTTGLRWSLDGETLLPYKTRGISNEMLGDAASVDVKSGLVLISHHRMVL